MTSLVGALHRSRSEETQQLGMLRRFLRQNQAVESTARLPPVREFARNSGAGTPGERRKRGGGQSLDVRGCGGRVGAGLEDIREVDWSVDFMWYEMECCDSDEWQLLTDCERT